MRLRHILSVAIVFFAAVSASADGKAIPNPCSLLNESEASAAIGAPAKFGMKLDQLGTCVFNDANGVPVFSVRGSLHANKYDAYIDMQELLRGVPPRARESISDLGDHAQFVVTRQGDLVLLIQQQEKLLVLSLLHTAVPSPSGRRPFLEQAGRLASTHL